MHDPHTPTRPRLFHGTGTSQTWITQHGLIPSPGLSNDGMLGDNITHAIFMTPDPDDAATYGSDVYEVDTTGIDLIVVDGFNGYHYAATTPITPDRLTLHTDQPA